MSLQPVARQGDTDSHGAGALISSVTSVKVNGVPISTVPDNASSDSAGHSNPQASTGSATVKAGGRPVHRLGDSRTCGATTVTASSNVFCG